MTKTKFVEALEEIKKSTVNESGKKKAVTFNKASFDDLFKSYLNSPDYDLEEASADAESETGFKVDAIKSVQKLRGMFKRVLIDYGVDKAEAESVMNDYQFTNVDGVYEAVSEVMYQYLAAGKKFNFITKSDFVGSLTVDTVEAGESNYRDIQKGTDIKIAHKEHKKLNRKSTVPTWLKSRID